MKPEDSPWLKEILNEVNSTDEGRRMFAVWRFKETLQQFVRGGPERTKAVNVSIFLLTHGFAKEIHRGLTDAVQTGRWYFVAKDYFEAMAVTGTPDSGVFSRVSIYATAIEALIVDTRTLRYLLAEMPDLFQVLPSLFLKAQTLFPEEGRQPSPDSDPGLVTKKMLLKALGALFLFDTKGKHAKRVASFPGFTSGLVKLALENVEEAGAVDVAVKMLDTLECFFDIKAMSDDILGLVVELLNHGIRPRTIYDACRVMIRLLESYESPLELVPHLITRESSLRNPFLALAVCHEAEPIIREYAQMMSCLFCGEALLDLQLPVDGSISPDLVKALELVAMKDEKVTQKARQLTAMWKTPPQGRELYLGPIQPLPLEKGMAETLQKLKSLDKKPCRKCSRAGCDRVEACYKEFKICSGCKLACYCSRECQKNSWKEGHKEVCRRGSRKATGS
ncbi:hypothetical protein KFL_001130050 [Klebsormidium nitens]|uniref:MYND-type domain-containing protein n=1 Tax=Klebsormidium nitens TaxID=105231 RepID=A0A0U9HRE7_KLENI|nr:hypothetical protein KFL_001130050 [Klebsormidium nitens]|eukprot:GAQ82486.1 hypothetical protein KFL_001130050 [Klebsormidium nitens]